MNSPKKQPPIPFLPEGILVDILAHVPRCYWPSLSQVSRRFRSLINSPELYARRTFFGIKEECLYVAISKDQNSDIHWFTLNRIPNTNGSTDNRLIHVPSLPPMPLHGSYLSIGSNIYVMGGFNNWRITSSVSRINCQNNTVRSLVDMPKAVAGSVTEVIDGRRIYVIGGSDNARSPMKSPSRSMMVFDTETEMWTERQRPDWECGKKWLSSVAIGGKIYMRTCYHSFVLDVNNLNCISNTVLHSKEWSGSCVIDDVLFYYDVRGNCLRAYDPRESSWRAVKGLEGLLPEACNWSKTVSYYEGGKLTLFLQKTEIWCVEIAVQMRQGEIWGKVESCSVVLGGGFHVMDCVAVVA